MNTCIHKRSHAMTRLVRLLGAAVFAMQGVTLATVACDWRPLGIHSGIIVVVSVAVVGLGIVFAGVFLATSAILGRKAEVRLRSLFICVTIAAMSCISLRLRMDRAWYQHRTCESLKGFCVYADDDQERGVGLWPLSYLDRLFGRDFFCDVAVATVYSRRGIQDASSFQNLEELNIVGCVATDSDACVIRRCRRLITLRVEKSEITDAGLCALTDLKYLRTLHLDSQFVTNRAGVLVARMRRLRDVALTNCCVDDKGVAVIASIPGIKAVDFSGTSISDGGLWILAREEGITRIGIRDTRITDEGIRGLLGCRHVKALDCAGTSIGDDSMIVVGGMNEIVDLKIGYTAVSDSGLRNIVNLHRLRELDIQHTQVTDASAGVILAQSSLESITVHSGQLSDETIGVLTSRLAAGKQLWIVD